jgi:hypothetical protein
MVAQIEASRSAAVAAIVRVMVAVFLLGLRERFGNIADDEQIILSDGIGDCEPFNRFLAAIVLARCGLPC